MHLKAIELQTNRFVDFKYIYTQCTVMISTPFRIGFAVYEVGLEFGVWILVFDLFRSSKV